MIQSSQKLEGANHPLLRGADICNASTIILRHDLSPPARGRRNAVQVLNGLVRFIPSCDGQTEKCELKLPESPIYPLLRGADNRMDRRNGQRYDLSPPARGRLCSGIHFRAVGRFIPSCEGQTLSVYAAFSRLKHLVVQFAQMPFSTRHTSFPLLIICLKNIPFVFFTNIF